MSFLRNIAPRGQLMLGMAGAVIACGLVETESGSENAGGGGVAAEGGTSSGGQGGSSLDASAGTASDAGSTHDASDADPPDCPEPGPSTVGNASCAQDPVCACSLSCCDRRFIPGGWFPMGRSLDGTDAAGPWNPPTTDFDNELPEHQAEVADFYLDTFEVTVGRFREFVSGYPANLPQAGAGAHPQVAGSGWSEAWNGLVPPTKANLEEDLICDDNGPYVPFAISTWTPEPAGIENYPINCVNWYVAFAFCVWDGGRLPTEAEWEYAAAGGDENRRYPWGPDLWGPGVPDWWMNEHACLQLSCLGQPNPRGMGRWGNFELGGSISERVLDDGDTPYTSNPCTGCVEFDTNATPSTCRGGAYLLKTSNARAAWRGSTTRLTLLSSVGFRCARSVR